MSAGERLFVAQALTAVQRDTLQRALALPTGWRPVPPANWHLTLFFAGTMPTDGWRDRATALATVAAQHMPFEVTDAGLEVVIGRDRMVWLRFAPHPAFDALHRDLAAAFELPPDPRSPHWPHVTLARSRQEAKPPVAGPDLPTSMSIHELTLFRSEPGDGHPRYVPLARYPLQKSSS